MQAGENEVNPYLFQEVQSASPARLRLLLIRRCEELCGFVAQLWAAQQYDQASQWMLRIREILGELLGGVQDQSNPLSSQISDFYLFLLQMTTELETSRDLQRLAVLTELLSIEAETWRQVLAKVSSESVALAESKALFPTNSELGSLGGGAFSLEV